MRLRRVVTAGALAATAACGGGASTTTEEVAPTIEPTTASTVEPAVSAGVGPGLDEILALPRTTFDDGVLETFDDDGDGRDDRALLSFAPVDLGTATVTRTVELDAGEAATITITLEGDGPYEHVEVIPKSLATDVADLAFSIEPDEIVDPDPTVKWFDDIIARAKGPITITVGWKLLTTGGPDLTDAMEHLDDIRFIAAMEQMKATAAQRYGIVNPLDLITVLGRYPGQFEIDDCGGIYDPELGGELLFACRALVSGRIDECDQAHQVLSYHESPVSGETIEVVTTTKAEAQDSCRLWAFAARFIGCQQHASLQRDRCIHEASRWSTHDGCRRISDPVVYQTCKADLTQDDSWCIQLIDIEAVGTLDEVLACCDTIHDDARRSRCREYVTEQFREDEARTAGSLSITYEPYDDQLETGKDYTFWFGLDPLRERVVYEIDWGDGITTSSYEPSWTYRYPDQGIYTVRVQARDETSGQLLASGELDVETAFPYGRLELLQSTTKLVTRVSGTVGGMAEASDSVGNDGTIVWNGRQFEVDAETRTGELSYLVFHAQGSVNEDATEIVDLAVHTVLVVGAITTDITWSASGLPLEPDREIPTVRVDDYQPVFRTIVEGGPAVGEAVDRITGSRTDATETTTSLEFTFDDTQVAGLVVIFS